MQRILLVLLVVLAMIIVAGTFITNQQTDLEAGGLGPALPTAASPYCNMSNSDFFNEMGIEECP